MPEDCQNHRKVSAGHAWKESSKSPGTRPPRAWSLVPIEFIHSDLSAMKPPRLGLFRYFILFVDDCTRHSWTFPLYQDNGRDHSDIQELQDVHRKADQATDEEV